MKPRLGLMLQLFFFIVLPLAGLLLVVSFGSVLVHQSEMRRMVGERDVLAVRAAAEALRAEIERREDAVRALAERPASPGTFLAESALAHDDFDLGLALVDRMGHVLAQTPWSSLIPKPGPMPGGASNTAPQLTVVSDSNGRPAALASAWSADGEQAVIGAFALDPLFERTSRQILPSNPFMRIAVVDENRQVLYADPAGAFEGSLQDHAGVSQALEGQSGTSYVAAGSSEHVMAFAPVGSWALLMEEPWQQVVSPLLNTSQVGPLVMAPLLLMMVIALWFGARQIIQPLQQLEAQAARLAAGDLAPITPAVGGIEEIRRLQKALLGMAQQLQAAQASLHHYIGAITAAQEEERLRLARDLHDVTLQSLIALKQRLQLAAPAAEDAAHRAALDEMQQLADATMLDLRRTMRALRPIYLDDLGLVPALEMLAREAAQPGLVVEFKCEGHVERLGPAAELALYRIAQEALNNVQRHAHAMRADLAVSFGDKRAVLMISDNGLGFPPPSSPGAFAASGHFGLLGMRERADLIGARLEILPAPGRGTTVRVSLPIPAPSSGTHSA